MTTKWNALALGLAATVIFSAGETQAQGAGITPAEISVTRDTNVFIFSSNPLQDPTGVCAFDERIEILRGFAG